MAAEARWTLWRYGLRESSKGKPPAWTKAPFRLDGHRASSTNPATSATFAGAIAALERGRGGEPFDGIGFVLGGGWAGMDLDDVRDPATGELLPWAEALVESAGTYAEVNPSTTGMKLFGHAVWDKKGAKRPHPEGGELELYGRQRYFAVTGHRLPQNPAASLQRASGSPASSPRGRPGPDPGDDALLERMFALKKGAARRLWNGDNSRHGGDTSRGDLTLRGRLPFWCGGPDAPRVDRLFRRSPRMRPKWDERRGESTWGAWTVAKALRGRTEYSESRGSAGANAVRFETAAGGWAAGKPATPARGALAPRPLRMSDVTPGPVDSLWPGRIAVGCLTLLNGPAGLGESFLTADLSARVTTGGAWPDGGVARLGDVLLMDAEQRPESAIAPRLLGCGADLSRVHLLTGG